MSGRSDLVPPWLGPLLATHFFSACEDHADAARSECNMYCIDCGRDSGGFCFYCRSEKHERHRVIQIRRSSYHDVVRVSEVQRVLDIGGVQTYVINSARVLFLNERPQPRGASGGAKAGASTPHACEICARSLLDHFRFCSLGCKLVGIKRKGDASFMLGVGGGEGESSSGGEVAGGLAEREGRRAGSREGAEHNIRLLYSTPPPPPPPPRPSSRRRKGVPHRAPLHS